MTASLRHRDSAAPVFAPIDPNLLDESRAFCRRITRREAKNFYYGLKLLPEPKRSAMYTLYAYMRLIDDIADDDAQQRTIEERRSDLDRWQRITLEAPAAQYGASNIEPFPRLWPAFADMVRRYRVPLKLFQEMIDGQRQDLQFTPVVRADDLHRYCYRVASVVGIASLYVWGFEGGEETLKLAADRGIAFQLTNVLRDLREDSGRGRCYLPAEELARFHITADDLARDKGIAARPDFLALMRFQIDRARDFYVRSARLDGRIEPDSRPTLAAMTSIYRGLLEKIAADPARVMRQRVSLSTFSKLLIGWRALRSRPATVHRPC